MTRSTSFTVDARRWRVSPGFVADAAIAGSLVMLLALPVVGGCHEESSRAGGDTALPEVGSVPNTPAQEDAAPLADTAEAGRGDSGSAMGAIGVEPAESVAGCVDRAVRWSFGGWFGWGLASYSLQPCRDFAYEYSSNYNGPVDVSCAHEVAEDAPIDVDDVDRALAHPDVLEALAEGGLLGAYTADAPTFGIEVEGHGIALYMFGCGGQPGCADIPQAVSNLRGTLEAFARDQVSACTDDEADGGAG